MKCKRCGKQLKREVIHTGWNWSDGTEIIIEAYSCTCVYKKGIFK